MLHVCLGPRVNILDRGEAGWWKGGDMQLALTRNKPLFRTW